jgi:argininosuccinate lyase
MLGRDRERLSDCLRRVNRSPLGAVALAGTSLPIDRNYVAAILHFDRLIDNSIDAVSDRDVHIEFLACCSILMMHLSRLAEELVLWSSREWQFVEIHDSFSTGSSIMPQKKNPDIVELVRGKTGRVYGDLMALLTVMKGLPLAYNRDMQEDKQPLFDAADTAADCLVILSSVLRSVKFYGHRFEKDLVSDPIVATELADYLVRKGLPFRKAHGIVGGIVRSSLRKNIPLSQLSVKEYRQYSRLFGEDVTTLLDTRASLSRKKSSGSTSPKHVRRAIRSWKKALEGM